MFRKRGTSKDALGRWSAIFSLLLLASCGGRPPTPEPSVRPSGVNVTDFLTALEAVRLATERVPGASGLFGVSVSFPRTEGRSEFWTIDLAHPDRPAIASRVEIQGRRVVALSDVPMPPDARSVAPDLIKVDSAEAVRRVNALSWFRSGDEITLAPQVLRVGDDQVPRAKDRAFWHLIVLSQQPQRQLRGSVWIATDNAEVLFECHPPEVSC